MALVGCAAIGLIAAIAPTPGKISESAAGAWTTKLMDPAGPLTAALDGAIELPTECGTDGDRALHEPTVFSARELKVAEGLPFDGRTHIERRARRTSCV